MKYLSKSFTVPMSNSEEPKCIYCHKESKTYYVTKEGYICHYCYSIRRDRKMETPEIKGILDPPQEVEHEIKQR